MSDFLPMNGEPDGGPPRAVRLHLRGHTWSFSCDEEGLAEMIDRVVDLGRDPSSQLGRFGAELVREQLLRGVSLPEGLHRSGGASPGGEA